MIVSSDDSTDTGDEESMRMNKLSALKMISTVEEESLRYDLNPIPIINTISNAHSMYRQDKARAKKRKRRHPNYSTLTGNT